MKYRIDKTAIVAGLNTLGVAPDDSPAWKDFSAAYISENCKSFDTVAEAIDEIERLCKIKIAQLRELAAEGAE